MITHDDHKGWATHDGDPRWRSTQAALRRLAGADVAWLRGRGPARHLVAHLSSGTPVATIRHVPNHKAYIARVEGFEFWGHNRVVGHEMWMTPRSFPRQAEAVAFVARVIAQAGGRIPRTVTAKALAEG